MVGDDFTSASDSGPVRHQSVLVEPAVRHQHRKPAFGRGRQAGGGGNPQHPYLREPTVTAGAFATQGWVTNGCYPQEPRCLTRPSATGSAIR
jgi:hypothetical protein